MKKHKILDKKRLMKNTTSIISILVVALLVFSSAVSATTSSNNTMTITINEKITPIQQGIADVSPNINIDPILPSVGSVPSQLTLSQQGNNPQTMDMWDLVFSFDVATASGLAGNTGAHCVDDEYLYSSRWASSLQHQYNRTGVLLKEYSVSGVSGIRDLAYDGEYLYAGPASGTIWGWDPIGETLEVTITGGFQCRACAYNDDDDTFFVSNWGDPVWEVDRDGDIVDSFNLALTYSTYGFAYDQWSEHDDYDGPFMWVYDQGGTGSLIHQWDLPTGEFTGEGHDVEEEFPNTIAGGLSLTEDFVSGKALLIGLAQASGDPMFIYDIDAITIPPEHDVALKKILQPEDGYAVENVPMKVLIKNTGNNTETFDAQMNIIKCEGSGELLLDENFSGDFPPENWTTDWWKKSNTNNAGAIAPEARCYYRDQYYAYPRDYYDNNITSRPINCSGLEKVNLRFAFGADVQSNCYMYVKFRKNSTSSWKDVTPWDVPITSDFSDWFEIGCYGFQAGGDIGSEFQLKFEYIGHYSYFRNWYLDDVTIEPCGGCAEYADIVEDITLVKGEEVEVEFPAWTPSEWQNESTENTYQEYPIQAFTLLEGDEVQKNNEKWKLVEIYFPWMDDVAAIDFKGAESGPAQTFDMASVIKNVGQNDECCFKTHVAISEIDYDNPTIIYTEDFESGYGYTEPTGWTTGGSQYYAWYCYYFSYYLPAPYGGGKSMRCYWYYSTNAELISPEFDSSGIGNLEAEWGMYYWHRYNEYEVYVDIRPNPDAFWGEIQPWDNPVTGTIAAGWQTADATIGVGTQTQIRFRTGGYYYNMVYWFIDNLKLTGYDVKEPEFKAEVCVESIIPGEELEFDYGTWTPEFLAEETTGTITYILQTWTNLEDPPDRNPANDLYQRPVVLDFFHDVGIQDVTAPSDEGSDRIFYAIDCFNNQFVWFDPDTPGTFNNIAATGITQFPQGATFVDDVWWVCDTTGNIWTVDPATGVKTAVGNAGTGELTAIAYHEKSKTMYGGSSNNFYEIDMATGAATLIGPFQQLGYYMISLDCDKDGNMYGYDLNYAASNLYSIDLDTGKATVIGNTGVSMMYGQDMAYDWAEETMYACVWDTAGGGQLREVDLETGAFSLIGALQGGAQTTCFAIPGGGLTIDVYVPLGSQNIDAIVENIGTFPELDLTCYAEIYEFITNCTNGTLVYEDNISDIDLDVPLGGTETLNFDSYNFAIEGMYGLFLNLPDDDDDYLKNNEFVLGIGADDTSPVSNHALDPATPDGDNGWYVSDVEVTLNAGDPSIGCEAQGSGVKEIKYKIGTGGWQTIGQTSPGSPTLSGTFIIDVDAENLPIEYYAVDYVGNEEGTNSFTINMDQTVPDIEDVTWEAFQDPPLYGLWYVTFTCDATDATSGMDRVEMFINDGYHDEVIGSGPIYEFTIEWSEAFKKHTFWFYHYDVAGNMIEDDLPGDQIESYANNQQQQSNPVSKLTQQ